MTTLFPVALSVVPLCITTVGNGFADAEAVVDVDEGPTKAVPLCTCTWFVAASNLISFVGFLAEEAMIGWDKANRRDLGS